jgi:hypothetical protein
MPTKFSQTHALASLINEAARLQYVVDCELDRDDSPKTYDRTSKRLAYLTKLIDKTERAMFCDTAH